MRWKVAIGLSAILLGLFASHAWSKEKDKGGWEKIDSGGRVLKLWETKTGPKRWPEIAVLDLPNGQYTNLKKDVSKFLNDNQVFSKPVQPGASVTEAEPPPSYSGPWSIICLHTSASISLCVAAAHVNE